MIRGAFPASAQGDLSVLLELLPPGESEVDPVRARTADERGRLAVIDGETVRAFYRISNAPVQRPLPGLTDLQVQILGCVYTRHSNGFVRERHVDDLLSLPTPWTPMFVLQLLGEYVIEIVMALGDRMVKLDRDAFVGFRDANPNFVSITCERIVSYWLCYYSSMALAEYPAYRMMNELGIWDERQGARWLRVASWGPRKL